MSVHGTSDWQELAPRQSGWRMGTGDFTTRTWQGPTASVASFLRTLSPTGLMGYRKDESGDLTTVVAEYGAASPQTGSPEEGLLERYWELDGNDIELELWRHPEIVAALRNQSVTQIAKLRALIDKVVSGEIEENAPTAAELLKTKGNNPFDKLVRRLSSGVEAMEFSQYVLRKTEVVLRNTSLRANHANKGKQFRYQDLIRAEPTLLQENWVAAADLKNLMWVKKTPKGGPSSRGQWEIRTEYWGAEAFDDWLHPFAVSSAALPKAYIDL